MSSTNDTKKWVRSKSTVACPNAHGAMQVLTDEKNAFACGECNDHRPHRVLFRMTFAEAVDRYAPIEVGLALTEPWVSGGTTEAGIIVSHSEELPIVYSFIWRLHQDYKGELTEGDLVVHPRYGYEVVCEGSGVDGKWQLAVMRVEDIEAIVQFDDEELVD